jgi:hypothetical protein
MPKCSQWEINQLAIDPSLWIWRRFLHVAMSTIQVLLQNYTMSFCTVGEPLKITLRICSWLRRFQKKPTSLSLRSYGINYVTQHCPHITLKNAINGEVSTECPSGSACSLAHGVSELEYHPLRYKTIACLTVNCDLQECPYYHFQEEKRIIAPELFSKVFRMVPRNRLVEGTYKNDL